MIMDEIITGIAALVFFTLGYVIHIIQERFGDQDDELNEDDD